MNYESSAVDALLKCSFCELKFTDEVKIITECGNSICGDCYEDLRSRLDKASQFECRACSETHVASVKSMAENRVLARMLELRPQEKGLNEKARTLKSFLQLLQEKVEALKLINKEDEVNAYCDSLEMEITETLESSVNCLNSIAAGMMNEIKEYRSQLLSHPPSQVDSEESTESPRAEARTEQELEKLTADVKKFTEEWTEYFTQISRSSTDQEIQNADYQARDFYFKIRLIKSQLRKEMFNSRFLRFKENAVFSRSADYLGRMVYDESERRNLVTTLVTKPVGESKYWLAGHTEGGVNQVLALPNGNLATCSSDMLIKIWDSDTGNLLFDLKDHIDIVYALEVLPNGWLASGSADKTIKIWDLTERKLVKTLRGHTGAVISLRALPNGNLASCALDDTICTWNPYLSEIEVCQILTIPGHGVTSATVQLGLMSNGYLVTCSSKETENSTVRIWNPSNGQLFKSFCTESKAASCLSVLANDNLAVGFDYGDIKMFYLSEEPVAKLLEKCHVGGVWSLQPLSCGLVISGGSANDPTIKIWDPVDGDLLQTVTTDFSGYVRSIAVSKSGILLASGSADVTVKAWFLNKN